MKFIYDLAGSEQIVRDIPVYGAGTSIVEGAAVMRGATPGTNQGFAIVAAGALADILGVLKELHTNTVAGADSKQDGTAYTYKRVLINPFAVYRAEYDASDSMAVASTSTTTVTVTSLEDDIDGGWLLGNDGRLEYITTSTSGSCTTKGTSGWTSANTLVKVLPLMHQLIKITTAGTKLGTDAAAGSGRAVILENYLQANTVPLTKLNPTKHSGITYTGAKVFSEIRFLNHAYQTID